MPKVVINDCYGGFGLSAKGIKRLAELQNRECYFFDFRWKGPSVGNFKPVSLEEAEKIFCFHAYDVPNPEGEDASHAITIHDLSRADPNLVKVVEELGEAANSSHAELKIVEIPDDVEFVIQEYDGIEWVAEKHRTWS